MQSTNLVTFIIITLFSLSCTAGITKSGDEKRNMYATKSEKLNEQMSQLSGKKTQAYAPGEVLVKFQQGTKEDVIKAIQDKLHLTLIRTVSPPYLFLMKINDDTSVEEICEKLLGFEEVLYAEPNYIRSINTQ